MDKFDVLKELDRRVFQPLVNKRFWEVRTRCPLDQDGATRIKKGNEIRDFVITLVEEVYDGRMVSLTCESVQKTNCCSTIRVQSLSETGKVLKNVIIHLSTKSRP